MGGLLLFRAWRISSGGAILAGSYDYDGGEVLERSIKLISGKTLQAVVIGDQSADARFGFEGGLSVELFDIRV